MTLYIPLPFPPQIEGVGVPIWHNFMGNVGLIWGRACHFVVICGFYMVFFYFEGMIIYGHQDKPFCNKQKAIL